MRRMLTVAVVTAGLALLVAVVVFGRSHAGAIKQPALVLPAAGSRSPAAAFAATTLSGSQVSLRQFRGKPLVINFFAAWCDPCKREAPQFVRLDQRYGTRIGLLSVAINTTRRSSLDGFIRDHAMTWPVVWDRSGGISPSLPRAGTADHLHHRRQRPGGVPHHRPDHRAAHGRRAGQAARRMNGFGDRPLGRIRRGARGLRLAVRPTPDPWIPLVRGRRPAGGEAGDRRPAVIATLAFTAGFAAVFTLAGAGAGLIGAQFEDHRRALELAGGVAGDRDGMRDAVRRPDAAASRMARDLGSRPRTATGAAVVGAAFAVGWSPCIGPTLASILAIAASQGRAGEGAALLFAYSLGLAVPLIAAGLFFATFLDIAKPLRPHLGTDQPGGRRHPDLHRLPRCHRPPGTDHCPARTVGFRP